MKRFQRIDVDKEIMLSFKENLKELGYKEIANFNGGDDDFLIFDTLRKEYIWCENGFSPFCSDELMKKYENLNSNEISLKELALKRY